MPLQVLSKFSLACSNWYAADWAAVKAAVVEYADAVPVTADERIAPKQNRVVSTDLLSPAILADLLSPDSCRFVISGIPNASSPSETVVESGNRAALSSLSSAHIRRRNVDASEAPSFEVVGGGVGTSLLLSVVASFRPPSFASASAAEQMIA